MGAVSAILHAEKDPNLWCLILDSPFSSLKELAVELGKIMTGLPALFVKGGLSLIGSSIKDRVGADILTLKPIYSVRKIYVPTIFAVGKNDRLV